jgi:4-amino-4-deoxy-L-arabinose transferase-like glycosyltransferase
MPSALPPMRTQNGEPLVLKILTSAAIAGAIGIFAYYATALFLKYPPVWPDEVIYANPAINLVRRGVMSSDIWPGILPGTERHAYIAPPVYFLYLTAWFHLLGISVAVIRLSSIAAGVAAMLATYFLGVKCGWSPWLSLLPPSLLAVDSVFLRASLIGRPDMLALALMLSALLMATHVSPSMGSLTPRMAFLAGLISGLAAMTHPNGIVAPLAIIFAIILSHRRGTRARALLPLLGGLAVCLLPWVAYILQDPRSFLAQSGSELFKRVTGQLFTVTGAIHAIAMSLLQYGLPLGLLAGLMWGAGLVGLCYAARGRRDLWVLPLCQIFLLPAISTGEYWYPVYMLPLGTLGVVNLARRAGSKPSAGGIEGLLTVILTIGFVVGNILHLSGIRAAKDRSDADYKAWCAQVSALIPHGSKVLLSVIPDPYFGLLDRPDLQLREFFPIRMPIDPQKYLRYIEDADYVVVGTSIYPSPMLTDFAPSHGQLVGAVGAASSGAYCARIYKLPK